MKQLNIVTPTADIMDGYIKVKENKVFRSAVVEVCAENAAYFVLRNPQNSNVNVFLRTLHLTNYSSAPLSYEIYYYGDLTKKLPRTQVVSGNTYDTTPNNQARVYAGTNTSIVNGVKTIIHNVPAYESYRTWAQGSVLIAPGMNHIIKVVPLTDNLNPHCAVTFDWWEEPICKSERLE